MTGARSQSAASLPETLGRSVASRRAELGAFADWGRWLASTASTNDEAARWAQAGADDGSWMLADEQTAGRGRRGRTWQSPPGAGLYFSAILRPAARDGEVSNDQTTPLTTLMAGVALAEAVRAVTGVPVTLKWPNDLIVEPSWRKVAGILTEASSTAGAVQFIIVGIGVNLAPAAYPADVAVRAVSLEELSHGPVDRDELLVELLAALADRRQRLASQGPQPLLDAWRRLSPSSRGCRVRWPSPAGSRSGTTAGLADDGALLVATESGTERIIAGDVSWE